ncbi:MAG: lamin tail domain-containing protein [Chloroflexi bacterium]|nr:lamin tail domain-containing protein [Chloroflexota bacterium]
MRGLLVLSAAVVAIGVTAWSSSLKAQPSPPTRFFGSLTINGSPATAGTVVRAFIGDKDCTTDNTSLPRDQGRYAVEVPHSTQTSGCGMDGATVTFRVNGQPATQTGTFMTGQFIPLDLTIGGGTGTPTPTPTATPTGTPTPTAPFTLSRLNFEGSLCIPPAGQSRCDDTRTKLWNGDRDAWTAEEARRSRPAPDPDAVFLLTYEFRIGAFDPAAIRSLAQGLGWPKVYITAIRYRGTAGGEADEYVEISNVGGIEQDMTGWRLHAVESNTDFFFSEGSVLGAGAVCRFYTGQVRDDSCPGTVNVATSGVWDDNAGSAELWYDPLALLADTTRYSANRNSQPTAPALQGVANP